MLDKHEKIARPSLGNFARTELAILGTPCGQIKQIAYHICQQLGGTFSLAYVDADHPGADAEAAEGPDPHSALTHGAAVEFTDKITHSRFGYRFVHRPKALGYDQDGSHPIANSLQIKQFFGSADAVLVNGNHFGAEAQIAVIDPKKPLAKKIDKLTNVRLVLLQAGVTEVPAEVRAVLAPGTPVLPLAEPSRVVEWVRQYLLARVPPLYGLVLAGGRSTRMGHDKGLIDYHGQPQRAHAHALAGRYCAQTYVSCRADQVPELEAAGLPAIADSFLGLGPFGGILSAFRQHPDAAWLVLATDLPLLSANSLAFLVQHRQPGKVATALVGTDGTGFPEPLICIWEPRAYATMLQFLAMGYNCPRKVLINSDIALLQPPDPTELANVNLPSEQEWAKAKLAEPGQPA
jgi:molybdopterin-guanine dinucleotide biosynthesis protein A